MVLHYNRKSIVLQQNFTTKMVSIRTNNCKKGQRILKTQLKKETREQKKKNQQKVLCQKDNSKNLRVRRSSVGCGVAQLGAAQISRLRRSSVTVRRSSVRCGVAQQGTAQLSWHCFPSLIFGSRMNLHMNVME